MVKPGDRLGHGFDGRHRGRRRPRDHDHRESEAAGRRDLAVGRRAAAVFGDHGLDAVCAEQGPVIRFAKRATGAHVGRVRKLQRRIDGIDAAHQIGVLRCPLEGPEVLAAQCQKDAARRAPRRRDGSITIGDVEPTIAGNRPPRRPPEREQGDRGGSSGRGRVRRDGHRERMRGVDQRVDVLRAQIGRKPRRPAEATDADRDCLRGGPGGPPGERNRDGKIGAARQAFAELAGFAGATENEEAWHAGC